MFYYRGRFMFAFDLVMPFLPSSLVLKPRSAARALLAVLLIAVVSGCSARLESDTVDGSIENYLPGDGVQRSIRISWTCQTRSLISSLFSPTGESSCNDERGYGEVTLPIAENGSFTIPEFDVRVTKLLSSPRLYVRWEIVNVYEDGTEDADLLTNVPVVRAGFFRAMLDEYRSLRHIAIEDACVDLEAKVIDGSRKLSFDEIIQHYPDSHNFSRVFDLSATLRRDGVVVTSPNFRFDYADDRFCTKGFGLFVPADESGSSETLSYHVIMKLAAGVVYSVSEPNPVSGQRTTDHRYVREMVSRKTEAPVPVMPVNRLPGNLIEPVRLELDITRPEPAPD